MAIRTWNSRWKQTFWLLLLATTRHQGLSPYALCVIDWASQCHRSSGIAGQLVTGGMNKPCRNFSHAPVVGPIAPVATSMSTSAPGSRADYFCCGKFKSISIVS